MPAKKVVDKELIIKNALILLEKKGKETINARAIAKKIGCSTQPIYLSFKSMDELKNELIKRCKAMYLDYLKKEKYDSIFMNTNMAFIRFAYENPNKFRYVYYDNIFVEDEGDIAFREQVINGIMKRGNYSKQNATDFYNLTAIFVHGMVSKIITSQIKLDWSQIERQMVQQFEALKKYFKEKI